MSHVQYKGSDAIKEYLLEGNEISHGSHASVWCSKSEC